MARSSNSFTKYTATKSANTFSVFYKKSANVFTNVVTKGNTLAFSGDDLGGDEYGADVLGEAYGIGEYGGISHFVNVTQPTVSH